ncbi:MAG: presenilin family intramembrane aspartyl protease [Candidatus Micrarchaeia archaeon]
MNSILKILILFIFAQILGLFTGYILFDDYTRNPYVSGFYIESGFENSFFDIFLLFIFILIGTALMIIFLKHYRGEVFFILFEFFLISVPSSIIFYSFSRLFSPYLESMAIGIFFGILLAGLRFKFNFLKNICAVFASAGIGAVFGISFSPLFVLLFLIVLAIYDYISVFKTKHMVFLAKEIINRNIALTVSSEEIIGGKPKRSDLGTGDIIAPIMLSVSLLPVNIYASVFVVAGAFVSVFLMFYLLRDKKIVIPALPIILAGMMIFLFLGYIFGIIIF